MLLLIRCLNFCCRKTPSQFVCPGCRHSKALRQDSRCPAATVTLQDVVAEAPRLFELLPADARKALSSAGSKFRGMFIAQVTVVTVCCQADLDAVARRRWPMLSLVILRHWGDGGCCSDSYSHTVGLGESQIEFSYNDPDEFSFSHPYESARVLAVSSRKPPVHVGNTAAKQLLHHVTGSGRSPTSLSLLYLDLPGLCSSILGQLNDGHWLGLHSLTLWEAGLTAADWLMLAHANLPNLTSLSIARNGLDADVMASLAKAKWPLLHSLHLSHEPHLNAVAIAHLGAASYSVSNLSLSDIPVTAAMAAELAQLSHLHSISLDATDLTAAAVKELAKANWPKLWSFTLHHNNLDASALPRHIKAVERLFKDTILIL